jgi:hypothetical protein
MTRWERLSAVWKFITSDNAQVAKGLFFKQAVPLLLSLGAFVPGYGILIALAGMPLSYLSGRYGSYLLNKVKEKPDAQLNGMFDNIHRLDELLDDPSKARDQNEIINRINRVIDDALDVKRFPFLGGIIDRIKPSPHNVFGRILQRWTKFAMLANVNTAIAKEDNVFKATAAGVKGSFTFLLYHTILPGIGNILEKTAKMLPGPLKWPVWGLAKLLEYMGWIRLAGDVAFSGNSNQTPQPAK